MKQSHQVSVASKSSVRKPLKDLPNDNGRFLKSVNPKKISMPAKEIGDKQSVVRVQQQQQDDDCLDRLLLVHSDLSSLTRQIDELVAQAFKLKATSKEGRQEIESFIHVVSNMLSSLKPWVPRFQKVLSSHIAEPENQLPHKTVSEINEDGSFEDDSPEKTNMDSLISPSPLVSWRAGCNVERGRQLFLLTPLPMPKTLSSRCQDLPKSLFEKISLNPAVEPPSTSNIFGDGNEDLLEDMATKPITSKPSDPVATEGKLECLSSPMFSKQNHFVAMTPCLNMSPPKSCVLLKPISQSSHKGNYRFRKSTPFPVGIHSHISESSGSEGSEDLTLKYPELLGIQRAYKSRMGIKDLESSPNWSFSPPKTCVVLEPPVEKSLDIHLVDHHLKVHAPVLNQQTNSTLSKECNVQGDCHQIKKPCNGGPVCGVSKLIIESTPLWKEPESTIRTGKRPGENTLKKELWTKFEAASTYGLRLNASAFQGTAQKGFLDMLDEASCDEGKSNC
ncbi:PREDICTED: uncharacterized protein LOC105135412 isoform X1 [Populus euphratica]|uniref:Uncharacterized protein LOC105135412 isoform X1 n=1 Tax=Populus euphratica TaxID=75702 RepID=A0AAJ6Y191_POPEU|nr:PREDICTED: uncharacterized protein LOC105135412 isoform X1 [Populus euphratica]